MAEGRSNAAIAGRLFITEKAVGKQQHLQQAWPAPFRGRQPPRAGRAGLPQRLTAVRPASGEPRSPLAGLRPVGYSSRCWAFSCWSRK
jgi:hypothetical protein